MLEKGMKFDTEKPRVELLDPLALEGLAKVLAFGAKKYDAHNWRGGIRYSRLLGAALRHIFAIVRGEDLDPESGLPHVDHLGCCWMFLSNMMKTRPDLDDRFKGVKSNESISSSSVGNPNSSSSGSNAPRSISKVEKQLAKSISHPSDSDFNYWTLVPEQDCLRVVGTSHWGTHGRIGDARDDSTDDSKQGRSVSHWGLL